MAASSVWQRWDMEVYCGRKYGAYEEWDTSSYEEAGDGESFDKDRRDDAEDSFCIQLVLVPTFKWHVAALWLSIFLTVYWRHPTKDTFINYHNIIQLYSSRYVNGFGVDNFESERLIKHWAEFFDLAQTTGLNWVLDRFKVGRWKELWIFDHVISKHFCANRYEGLQSLISNPVSRCVDWLHFSRLSLRCLQAADGKLHR